MSSDELEDIMPEADRDLAEIGELLAAGRSAPSAAFRGDLKRRLAALPMPMDSRRLWLLIASLAACAVIALGIVGFGVAGQGPLAPAHPPSHHARSSGR